MKNFRIELTEAKNGYGFIGEWDSDCFQDDVAAETKEEAIELAKQYIIDNGGNAENYIFRCKQVD